MAVNKINKIDTIADGSNAYDFRQNINQAIEQMNVAGTALNTAVDDINNTVYGEGGSAQTPVEGSVLGDIADARETSLTDINDTMYGKGGTSQTPTGGAIKELNDKKQEAADDIEAQVTAHGNYKTFTVGAEEPKTKTDFWYKVLGEVEVNS